MSPPQGGGPVAPPNTVVGGDTPPDTHGRLLELEKLVHRLMGRSEQFATKEDVAQSKLWAFTTIASAIVSLLAAIAAVVVALSRLFDAIAK